MLTSQQQAVEVLSRASVACGMAPPEALTAEVTADEARRAHALLEAILDEAIRAGVVMLRPC